MKKRLIILALITIPLIAKEDTKMKRIFKSFINNDPRWYLVRMTQEGALKWTSVLNQTYPNGKLAIVTTAETVSFEDVRNRDVIFHVYTTPRDVETKLQILVGDYLTREIRELSKPIRVTAK